MELSLLLPCVFSSSCPLLRPSRNSPDYSLHGPLLIILFQHSQAVLNISVYESSCYVCFISSLSTTVLNREQFYLSGDIGQYPETVLMVTIMKMVLLTFKSQGPLKMLLTYLQCVRKLHIQPSTFWFPCAKSQD